MIVCLRRRFILSVAAKRRVGKGARSTCSPTWITTRARRAHAVEGTAGYAWARRAQYGQPSRWFSKRAPLPTLQVYAFLALCSVIAISVLSFAAPARSQGPEQSSVRLAVGGKPA